MKEKSLFDRLGGYDAIVSLVDLLLPRLQMDPQLGRFWAHRGADGVRREKQLLIDFLCQQSGGPMYYRGRDMLTTHRGMNISQEDWQIFLQHAAEALHQASVTEPECSEVVAFVTSLAGEIIVANLVTSHS